MRKYVPAALAQARGRLGPASSALAPINFMGVVSWCPLYRDSFALIGGTSFVRCSESRSVRFSEVGFVLKLH